jgi:hypothetical protein
MRQHSLQMIPMKAFIDFAFSLGASLTPEEDFWLIASSASFAA